jgi:hypothetical protein
MTLRQNRQQQSKWNSLTKERYKAYWNSYNYEKAMFRVRVHKIESIRDLDGNLGKRIELIEDRQIPRFVVRPQTEEAKVVQDVMQALQQQLPMFPARAEIAVPKIILFLTEQEYESLGIDFDVNQIYEIRLENQTIKFRKTA